MTAQRSSRRVIAFNQRKPLSQNADPISAVEVKYREIPTSCDLPKYSRGERIMSTKYASDLFLLRPCSIFITDTTHFNAHFAEAMELYDGAVPKAVSDPVPLDPLYNKVDKSRFCNRHMQLGKYKGMPNGLFLSLPPFEYSATGVDGAPGML